MGLILDSSVLISAERQGKNARQMLTSIADKISETEVGISVVTLIELAHGAARADTPERGAGRYIITETALGWARFLPLWHQWASGIGRGGGIGDDRVAASGPHWLADSPPYLVRRPSALDNEPNHPSARCGDVPCLRRAYACKKTPGTSAATTTAEAKRDSSHPQADPSQERRDGKKSACSVRND